MCSCEPSATGTPLARSCATRVAVTWSPSGSRLYVNGVAEASSSANIWPALNGSNWAYLNNWGDTAHAAAFDEFHVSKVARSAADIAAHAGR